MGLSVFGAIVIVAGLIALYASYRWSVYGLAVFSLFACASALVLPGGIGILPANLFLVFFVLRAFNLGGGRTLTQAVSIGTPGFWLLCTCAWAIFGAIVLPRALAGSTLVYTIDRNAIDPDLSELLQPLGPVSGNLSQTVYCIGDVVVYCSMSVFLKYRGAYRTFANAILLLAALNVLAGLIDLASHAVGIDVLSVVKTAQFADFSGDELDGMLRISGTFSETSAFAFFTIQLFAFCLNLWLLGFRPRLAGALAVATGLLLLISTSGSAYVGLGLYLVVLLFSRPGRIVRAGIARKRRMWFIVVCLGVLGAFYIVLFLPGVAKVLGDFFDSAVLSKLDSGSGIERTGLNAQAMTNFLDTYGIGVGLGSVRVSSFAVVLIACLGVVGTVFYALFIVKSLQTPVPARSPFTESAVCYAARHGMIAALIVASISASVFELGVVFYMFAAAAGALSSHARKRSPGYGKWVVGGAHE
jgi:hypothetical protein